ncbi:FUSC family protein [Streptomyces collinus]|uniref:FUSC family protein n=1 Tax=Streptomyces collinus TaxID=42684 RepID=UPI0033B91B48
MRGVPTGRIRATYAASGRRALRVTLVAATGFYLFRYGLDRPVSATYALFAAVALGGLSKIPGTGRQRAAVAARLLPVCWAVVVAGTYLSVETWSAVVGMLLIGFALTFAAVGGPRLAGATPGLQLLYILPSFPPYDPASLGDRLLGTTTGLLLFIAAEALILPEPAPPPYRERAAGAARTAARCATLLATPPYTLDHADVRADRDAAGALRLMAVPEAERPAGPGVRERALTHTGLATRTLLSRLAQLPALPGDDPGPEVTAVLHAVARLSVATEACLGQGPSPVAAYEELAAARARLAALSGDTVSAAAPATPPVSAADPVDAPVPVFPPAVLRRHAAVLEIADAALAMGTAADLAVHGRRAAAQESPGRFWYATERAPALWWHRVRGHAERRSVFFQNAVRIALALAAARFVAGVDTLPHGFWATLATLTLTRTTVDETWGTIRKALTGTLAGALVTAGVLDLVATDNAVYAAVLPVWMLFAFTVGPVKGVGWAQGMFTVLVALVFAQLAPPTWHLAEVRMLDVLVGSAIGAVFGLLAWPRGAHDELRNAEAELLRRAAEVVVATSASVAEGATVAAPPGVHGHRSLQHAVILAESAYAQFLSEPVPFGATGGRAGVPAVDSQATLIAGHHTLWGSQRLLEPPLAGLVPAAGESVDRLGDRVCGRMLLVSAALDPGGDTPAASVARIAPSLTACAEEPPGAPRLYYATASWLNSLLTDLTRIVHGEPGHDEPADETATGPRAPATGSEAH